MHYYIYILYICILLILSIIYTDYYVKYNTAFFTNVSRMCHESTIRMYTILSLILSYSTMLLAGAADAKGEDVKDLPQRVTETRPGIYWDVSGSTGVPLKLSINFLFPFGMVKPKVRETDKSRCGSSTIGELC